MRIHGAQDGYGLIVGCHCVRIILLLQIDVADLQQQIRFASQVARGMIRLRDLPIQRQRLVKLALTLREFGGCQQYAGISLLRQR